ncbi:molybdopterin molybdotransferase MoeA [Sabulicella glaciei]|uniref:Molybdopterin molybdenumtransferase n=1 Tax=Sabulicella glaciei TaxID=2984948 RepID=A0ABT3NYC7_9PROT|nr:gephyrin-like molybdotransferase Glp [Roseococcus sp. MDT2-1-1]MCW8087164.1 molybdopterin molybdotransferase MoeA [Roseococcus sp. MDT2-1-1]
MIPVEEARRRILAGFAPTGPETIPVGQGRARVLQAPLHARRTQPPADVSAMDGYALRAGEATLGAVLRVAGESAAGHPFAGSFGAGEAVRISTGAFVPEEADAILLQEDATREGDRITVNEAPRPGRWIRREGLDFAEGQALLEAGRRLSARDVGLAAACGHAWLSVHRRPRVAILATGDEIALPGDPVPPGGIVSSNSFMLAALLEANGAEALVLPVAPDDPAAILAVAQGARGCDLLLTTGGASVGDHDQTAAALGRQGFKLDFWKIAMRPGKPLIFGDWRGLPVLGFPGNPVSTLVCAVVFLLPALARLSGASAPGLPVVSARCTTALPENDRRADHLRATLHRDVGELRVTPAPVQDSSMLRTLAESDALILRAPFAPALEAGAMVEVVDLAGLGV